ncbi:hypothetical protein FC756_18600 [Lysinibacillus mangiferihumi]|uniref:Uncharacterized protein n=1 Tax=Lysinibacillus mangiferihumi TaxID=1130819 RepID=A0A4U2YPC1_9BACI|nr:hypothetical protein [Lysinibacillus mangiferihumi]TKI63197.1 hypothetical protein FC756_18600 [Lysinibacillus mangiferihumi]
MSRFYKNIKESPFYWFLVCVVAILIVWRIVTLNNETKEFKQHLSAGNDYFEEGNYEMAVNELSLAVELKPKNSKAKDLLDDANKQLKNEQQKKEKAQADKREKESKLQEEKERKDAYTTFLTSFDASSPEGKVRIAMYEVLKNDYEKPENVSISSEIDDEGHITAIGKGRDGWSNDSIRDGFFEDITNILRKIKDVDGYTSISISLTFPMKDTYGNINDDEVITMLFFKSEIDKIDFSSFNYINLPDVATGYRLYPAFQ